ncbi:MAG: thymidine kinase [Nanoarchaeota archaeon]|nr:thymidine kinase [Nanoarchaeota archaeon]
MKKEGNYFVRPGVIEGFAGPMMSGKTGKLIQRVDPLRWMNGRFSYMGFKPRVDDRNFNSRSERDFIKWNYIKKPEEIISISKEYDLIAIDEIQFFGKNIVDVVLELQKQEKNIIFSGLDLDFRGEPFGSMPELMAIANEFEKLHSVCTKCGDPAYYTQRLINGEPAHYNSPLISIEGESEYTARCFRHHEVPGKP